MLYLHLPHLRRTTQSIPREGEIRHQSSGELKAVGDSDAVAAIAKNAGFMASSDDISLFYLLLQLTSLNLKTTERGKAL